MRSTAFEEIVIGDPQRYTFNPITKCWEPHKPMIPGSLPNPNWVPVKIEVHYPSQATWKRYRLLKPEDPETLMDPEHPGLVLLHPGDPGYKEAPFEERLLFHPGSFRRLAPSRETKG